MWFNAFAGRVYRDACASPLFRKWMLHSFEEVMNKGARPGYVDVFSVSNLRFGAGVMPPLLTNARWVPTSAAGGTSSWSPPTLSSTVAHSLTHTPLSSLSHRRRGGE